MSTRNTGRAGIAAFVSTVAIAAAACFVDNPGPPPPAATTAASSSGAGGRDAGGETGGGGGGADGGPHTMCTEHGGYGTIEAIVADFTTRLAADCKIEAYFATLPDAARLHFHDCLVKQLAVVTHCPGIKYDVDSNGVACRDMKTSHTGLGITQMDYTEFVKDLIASFTGAGFTAAETKALGVPLAFYHTDIVDNSAPVYDHDACDAGDGG